MRARGSATHPSTGDTATARLRAALGDASSGVDDPSTVDGPEPAPPESSSDSGSPGGIRDRLAGRWLPTGLRGARIDPGRRGAVALVAVVLAAAAAVLVLGWRSRPVAEPVRPPAVVAGPAPSAGANRSGPPARHLVVAVTGRVRRPGVVTLPAGSRVVDAVRAAGGPSPGADLALLNLARRLADGELVVVGTPGATAEPAPPDGAPGATAAGGSAAGGAVDLNTATLAQLDGLPGVGPVLAQRILDWRAEHGPFGSVEQLQEVSGIGQARFEQLRRRVTV